jgi:hypothetical protein
LECYRFRIGLPSLSALRARSIARIYATTGRCGEAADALKGEPATIISPASVQEAARLLRSAPACASSTGNIPSLGRLNWVYLYTGDAEQSLQMQERLVDLSIFAGDEAIEFWYPDYAPVRKTERFKAFARQAGLVKYWRRCGWPDQCHPTTGDDFECD